MRIAAFVRHSGANGLGHVGWGFDFDAAQINVGSVENPRGTPSCDPAQMGYWDVFCTDPLPPMQQNHYDALKYVDLSIAAPASAYSVAQWIKLQPYSVLGRNCLDDVYDVLRAYGVANLPPPSHDWLPNEWFEEFTGVESAISDFVWGNRPADSVPSLAALPVKEDVTANLFPLMPVWRDPGTEEWHDLQSQLAAASLSPYAQQHVQAVL